MSLLTNEEKERIKGLRCHAEVTKKVKEGKRPEAAALVASIQSLLDEELFDRHSLQFARFRSFAGSTKSLSSLKRKPRGDKVTKFFLCPFPTVLRQKEREEEIKKGQSIVYSSILMTSSFCCYRCLSTCSSKAIGKQRKMLLLSNRCQQAKRNNSLSEMYFLARGPFTTVVFFALYLSSRTSNSSTVIDLLITSSFMQSIT